MNYLDIIWIGVALSMDACALTIANCTTYSKTLTRKKEWGMPLAFALFQGVMPVIGYFFGKLIERLVSEFLSFITAGIFFLLAVKIVIDILRSRKKENELVEVKNDNRILIFTFPLLLLQALATSIDALVIGVTLVGGKVAIYYAVLIIAAITFTLVTLALLFGKFLGKIFNKYAEWVGAILLFILAVKSLIEGLI